MIPELIGIWHAGRSARRRGLAEVANPWRDGSAEWLAWLDGWKAGRR